jgi:glutamate synthase domain-containing protein 3
VVAYFTWIAEDVRRLLAELGCRTMDDAIGRVELLERVDRPEVPRAQMLDLSVLLADPRGSDEALRRRTVERNDRPGPQSLDEEILETLAPRLDAGRAFAGVYDIGNHDLTVGARIAGRIAERVGNTGLTPGAVRLRFRGSAGQSFGAFALPGMHLELEGEANDYVGKGLTGGEIVIRPFREAGAPADQQVILGNTVLYGATAGKLFAAGRAGDRFAVRNSGAIAVIEGAGAHCCEYMTAGVVVVLGPVGRNFAAGMSNGVAYVLDETETFTARCNTDMVAVRLLEPFDEDRLLNLLREHVAKTGSAKARAVLDAWDRCGPLFRKVVPNAAPTPAVAPVETTPVAV